MPEIQTERLLLRTTQPSDLAPIHEILRNIAATRFWSSLPHTNIEQSRVWLEKMINIRPEEGEDFVIEHQGRVIGKVGLHRFPMIGYILHPDYWGQGMASEALRVVLDRAFAIHHLPAVMADVDPDNMASLRLLDRLGFHESGRAEQTWLIGEVWRDSIYLTLDRQDWPHESD